MSSQEGVAELRVNPTQPGQATLRRPPGSHQGHTRLRAGQQLLIVVPDVNPFMHEVIIQGQPVKYDLAVPDVGGGSPAVKASSTTPPDAAAKTIKLSISIELAQEIKRLDSTTKTYLNILDGLRIAYNASAWPPRFIAACLQELHDSTEAVFGTSAPSAQQLAGQPKVLTAKLSQLREQATATYTRANQFLTQKPGKQGKQPAKPKQPDFIQQYNEEELATAKQQLTELAELEMRLQQALGTTTDEELLLLGRVYAKLRERAASPCEAASKVVAADGDELDVSVSLKPLADYKTPLAATPALPFSYARTLAVTQRFRVSVSAGVFVSQLINHRFSLFEDSTRLGWRAKPGRAAGDTATVPSYRRMKRIGRENTLDKWDVGITTLTHFHFRLFPALDVAASVGVGVQTSGVRAMGGGSLLFGGKEQRLCLTYGGVIGPVTRLSGGYAEGDKVAPSLSTVPTQTVNQTSWFVAATWNLTGTRK